MGLLSYLRPRLPAPFNKPPILYSATITTDDGRRHQFVYLEERRGFRENEIWIILNETEFIMPEDARFLITDREKTKVDGEWLLVDSIVPVEDSDKVESGDLYTPPEPVRGKTIPVCDNTAEFEKRADDLDPDAESLWLKLGRKSKDLL